MDATGRVTARRRGQAIIQARNEGVLASVAIDVLIPNDADGDGLPDEFEQASGLDPNDPGDAGQDADGDGLSNLQEFTLGTRLRAADSDGDGLSDSTEAFFDLDPLTPDPTTTVAGQVVDETGAAVVGAAAVVVRERFAATTGADGRFAIPAVPAEGGDLVVFARRISGRQVADGFSAPWSRRPAA